MEGDKDTRRVRIPDRPAALPAFRKPPVDEVALAVGFPRIPGFSQAHLGFFWQAIRNEYPEVTDQQPLVFPPSGIQFPAMVAQVGPPIFRTWFTTEDEVYVVQLQPDRLVLNWRKRGDSYPRFEPILERFIDALLKFWSFLKSENLNPTPINQVELSYVNWIVDISPPTYLRLALETAVTSADLSGYPTEQQWGSRYIVASEVFEANLDIACVKATRSLPPANEGTQFSLAFRSLLETDDDGEAPSIDLVVDRMAKGRSLIVQTFTDLTTEAGHAIWERTQ